MLISTLLSLSMVEMYGVLIRVLHGLFIYGCDVDVHSYLVGCSSTIPTYMM
jgi:hypothetical protein